MYMGFTTLEEIIAFAVEREETAYQLYKNAAEKSTSIAARKMFEEMAAEEAGHKMVFSRLEVAALHQQASSKIPDMHLSEYMVDIPLRPDMTYGEILRNAMKTEESAWKLYSAAAEMTDDPQLKKTLQVFAEVELGHKKRLEGIYDDKFLTEG
jgi:rubrerythrin